ncbi:MAG: hypothetical protein HZB54_08255 [Deltaproteobacteria bacterium]|nr:hypothetical protein [Deltaproteobacteria bacterium]
MSGVKNARQPLKAVSLLNKPYCLLFGFFLHHLPLATESLSETPLWQSNGVRIYCVALFFSIIFFYLQAEKIICHYFAIYPKINVCFWVVPAIFKWESRVFMFSPVLQKTLDALLVAALVIGLETFVYSVNDFKKMEADNLTKE